MATLIFIIWPAQIAYTNVLASEHLALVLFLALAIAFLQLTTHPEHWKRYAVLAGSLSAFGYAVRSTMIVAFVCGIGLLWVSPGITRLKLTISGFVVASFLIVFGIYLGAMTIVYQVTPLSQGYSTLLAGTNFQSGGAWNESDETKYLQHSSFEEANQYALRVASRRISSNPSGFIHLMIDKIHKTWSDETYGVMFNIAGYEKLQEGNPLTPLIRQVRQSSQSFHVFLIVWSIAISIWWLVKGNMPSEIRFFLLMFLGLTFLHMIFEAQARYHFWLEPVLIVLASLGITTIIKEITAERQSSRMLIDEVNA